MYKIHELAVLSGVSERALRYYDSIGLLCPERDLTNGYRLYGEEQVDRLQQILFYRELGVALEDIGRILSSHDFNRREALRGHLSLLLEERGRIDLLIKNVSETIRAEEEKSNMTDKAKFEGFKKALVDENERKYGKEVRERYGDDAADASNAKVMGMSREKYDATKALEKELGATLAEAVAEGDPAGEKAQRACELHRRWLCCFWRDGQYTPQAHLALTEGYVADERFTAYYDAIAPGAASFLRDAVKIYTAK